MERRILRFHDFDQVLHDADRLLAAGYQQAGNWTLAQIATHLALVIGMSLDGFPWSLPWPLTLPCAGWRWERSFVTRSSAAARLLRGSSSPATPRTIAPPSNVCDPWLSAGSSMPGQ